MAMTMMAILSMIMIMFMILWPVASAATAPGAALIKETCSKTIYPDLCTSTLTSDPQGLTADVPGLTAIAISVAHDTAVSTSNYILDELKTTGLSPIELQTLNDCSENYSDAVDLLGDSVGAVLDMKYSDVNSWVTAAMSDVDSCEQTSSGSVENLSQKNFLLSQLCSNALTLVKLTSTPN